MNKRSFIYLGVFIIIGWFLLFCIFNYQNDKKAESNAILWKNAVKQDQNTLSNDITNINFAMNSKDYYSAQQAVSQLELDLGTIDKNEFFNPMPSKMLDISSKRDAALNNLDMYAVDTQLLIKHYNQGDFASADQYYSEAKQEYSNYYQENTQVMQYLSSSDNG